MLTVVIACLLPAVAAIGGETSTFSFEPDPLRVGGEVRRSFDLDLDPGGATTEAVKLTNKTDEVRRFRIYGADARTDEASGAITVAAYGVTPAGVGSWIAVDAEEIHLEPGSAVTVPFTVERPETQDAGGLGAIVAEELREPDSGGGIEVAFRVAIVVRLSGEASGLEVAEPEFEIPVSFVPDSGSVRTELTNDTLTPVTAEVRFRMSSLTGRTWDLPPIAVHLAPGETQPVSTVWRPVPRWGGAYQPVAEVEWVRGTVTTPGARSVVVPLWLLALAILAVGARGLRELWTGPQERLPLARPAQG